MMKTFSKILLILAVIPFVGCNDIEYQATNQPEEMELFPVNSSVTKAPIDGAVALPTNRKMKVSAYYNLGSTDPRGSAGDYFSNATFTYHTTASGTARWRGGTTSAPAPKYWPLRGNLDIFAFSADAIGSATDNPTPTYNVGSPVKVSNGATITVGDNSSSQVDIVFGKMLTQTRIATGNPMTMHHAQALLVFTAQSNIARNTTTNYGVTIKEIVLENAYFGGTLKMDVTGWPSATYSECTWSSLTNQKTTRNLLRYINASTAPTTALDYEVPQNTPMNIASAGNHFGIGGLGIMVPEQAVTRFCIKYTVHNGKNDAGTEVNNEMEYLYNCSGDPWQEGKKYVYNLVFMFDQIEIVPSVIDWTDPSIQVPIPYLP